MKNWIIFTSSILFFILSSFLFAQQSEGVRIVHNQKKSKSWLVDAEGNRISKKYVYLTYLRNGHDLVEADSAYFLFTNPKNRDLTGIIDEKGNVIFKAQYSGEWGFLDEERFFLTRSEGGTSVFYANGDLDSVYSKNLEFVDFGVMLKKKDGFYAIFSLANEQLTEFIYTDFDFGHAHNDPPFLGYMTKVNGERDKIGLDGKVILK